MYNETKAQDQHAPAHHTEKKGEGAAINKLTENEDEGAEDTCGCGESHSSDPRQMKPKVEDSRFKGASENASEDSSRDPNLTRSEAPKKNAQGPSVKAVTEDDDENTAGIHKGNIPTGANK